MKTKLPIFRAGQYVRLNAAVSSRFGWSSQAMVAHPVGWRRLSHEEQREWYEQHRKGVAEGREHPFDSAGEPLLAPQDVYIDVYLDRVYEIVRGRVSAGLGYAKQPGCCLVRCLLTGEEFYVRRNMMKLA